MLQQPNISIISITAMEFEGHTLDATLLHQSSRNFTASLSCACFEATRLHLGLAMRHISAGVLEHCFSHSNLAVEIMVAMSRHSSGGEDSGDDS